MLSKKQEIESAFNQNSKLIDKYRKENNKKKCTFIFIMDFGDTEAHCDLSIN